MTKTIQEYLGIKPPKEYKAKKQGLGVDPNLLYGVELEIENLERDEGERAGRCVAGMQYHKDGSLRNNGGEFVTLPMNYSGLHEVLNNFFKAHEYDEDNYSERCSVHVHANCVDLTTDQVRLIVCLYQVLEKVLFNYVKADRDNNIFCVPLGESLIASKLLQSDEVLFAGAHRAWRKYTALNLLPLYTQGTIEFRHMGGTCDVEFILQWCDIIGCLFKYAREHSFDEVTKTLMELNTSSAYATFMQGVFPGNLYEVLAVGPYREFLEEGIINMKVMLSAPREESKRLELPPNRGQWQFFDEEVELIRQEDNNLIVHNPELYTPAERTAIREVQRQRVRQGLPQMTDGETMNYIGQRRVGAARAGRWAPMDMEVNVQGFGVDPLRPIGAAIQDNNQIDPANNNGRINPRLGRRNPIVR